jgi:hypothetical protein
MDRCKHSRAQSRAVPKGDVEGKDEGKDEGEQLPSVGANLAGRRGELAYNEAGGSSFP